LATFFNGKSYALFFDKNVLGYILDDSLTNSSGHPGANPTIVIYNASVGELVPCGELMMS
jgi:hypothetical protein